MIGVFALVDVRVHCVAGVNGGVASGEGGVGVSAGSEFFPNIELF